MEPRQFSACYEPLTAAEMRIVHAICAGYTSYSEMAEATGRKPRTIAKSFDGPPAAWKWSVDAGYYQNEHPARTCWTRIVKEKGGYSPAKLQEIATEFVKHQLAKNVQEAA